MVFSSFISYVFLRGIWNIRKSVWSTGFQSKERRRRGRRRSTFIHKAHIYDEDYVVSYSSSILNLKKVNSTFSSHRFETFRTQFVLSSGLVSYYMIDTFSSGGFPFTTEEKRRSSRRDFLLGGILFSRVIHKVPRNTK